MAIGRYLACLSLTLLWSTWPSLLWAQDSAAIRGRVTAAGSSLEGAYVGAHADGKTFTTYVMTDRSGQFTFPRLEPGSYTVFTQIPGYRTARTNAIRVGGENAVEANFEVEPETDFLTLVEQATNSELTESFPLSETQRRALDYRCGECHGAYYIAKSRFTHKDWALLVARMDDQASITPAGDISPPPRRSRPSGRPPNPRYPESEDESIARILAEFRGPNSPDFPIRFQPRASGELTRAVVTEYQIPRLGATPRTVAVDSRNGNVWYSDWRANVVGKVDTRTGEINEYPIPGVESRPPGLQRLRWDPLGNLVAGQIWAGRAIRFDVQSERVTGAWGTPREWVRAGGIGICGPGPDDRLQYVIRDALERRLGWIIDTETGERTQVELNWGVPPQGCDQGRSYNDWEVLTATGPIAYRDPDTGEVTEFAPLSPWARPGNAIGDPARNVGWSVPAVSDRVVKIDRETGKVAEFPLPSHGKDILNIDIDLSADPPALWFVNQRLGRIVRFQEYTR